MKKYQLRKEADTLVEIYMPNPGCVPTSCLDYDSGHASHWAVVYPVSSKARAILNAAQGIASFTTCDYDQESRSRRTYFRFEFDAKYAKDIFMYLVRGYL